MTARTEPRDRSTGSASVDAVLCFTRPEDVAPDPAAPHRLRARTLAEDALLGVEAFDRRRCRIHDCAALADLRPSLRVHGFSHADLSDHVALQRALERIRVAGRLEEPDVAALRRHLQGAALRLADGRRLRILYVAPEGLLMRSAGPDGRSVRLGAGPRGLSDHDAAMAVHADQDVTGTPVKQILRRTAPLLFHHDSPGHQNRRSPLHLVNLWIPLQQVTRPLALMDRRTLDRGRHQLCYGLPTDGFLERAADRRVNDIWTFLHDPGQRWYFTSEMDARTAYVFDTLSTPHAAFVLPGEARAAQLDDRLSAALAAIAASDEAALRRAARPLEPDADADARTPALARAVDAMAALVDEARRLSLADDAAVEAFCERARAARDRVVRRSLELRAVGLMLPSWWPQARRRLPAARG
ncbi:MAG: hypothetical protein KC636_30970 [Myxococcales bacterium]|nr:hypothetical protein [Myxococcales bacterium]